MNIREAAVAGFFYPDNAEELREFVKNSLNESPQVSTSSKAIIVPHAGYVYSGKVAAAGFRQLSNGKGLKKILLIGPSHRIPVLGMAMSDSECFMTPLGKVRVSQQLRYIVSDLPTIQVNDRAHQYEHSIEVQLPFLQMMFGEDVEIFPLLTNNASPYVIESVVERLWPEVNHIIVSTDLSHYLTYEEATRKDQLTCKRIESLDYKSLHEDDACGLAGVRGLLLSLANKGVAIKCVDRKNSGDTGGERDRVVGYASFCSI